MRKDTEEAKLSPSLILFVLHLSFKPCPNFPRLLIGIKHTVRTLG